MSELGNMGLGAAEWALERKAWVFARLEVAVC
jgi:hypothetical protein